MKAELGKEYAQIRNGRCHWKFTINELPEWKDDAFQVVEITNLSTKPDEGDLFDGVNFSKPVIITPPARTKREQIEAVLGMTITELKAELVR